jgi:Domain of unknown function (DUF222)
VAPHSRTVAQLKCDLEVLQNLEGSIRRQKLEALAALEQQRVWRADGAKDMAHWASAHCDESPFATRRWLDAAARLPELPHIRRALSGGRLSLAKVCELTRFATPETEARLVSWAQHVSTLTVRRKADAANVDPIEEVKAQIEERSLAWWYEQDRRLHLEGVLPPEQGAVVVKALERVAQKLPADPERDSEYTIDARRADALVALASQEIVDDPDSARARVNLHVELTALSERSGSAEIEGGGIVHPEVASRLACDAIVTQVLHDPQGHIVGIGRASRNVPEWLYRQVRLRDNGCTFPGCHHKRYVQAHHIWWWEYGGPTNLDNLVLVCDFHHKLVHEGGWRVELGKESGVVHWFRPNNQPYEPNRAPPDEKEELPIEWSSDEPRELVAVTV